VAYSSFCSSYDIIREMGNPFLALKVKLDDETILVQSNLVGDYNAENLLAAITVGRYFDVDITAIKNAIESYTPTNNRSQFLKTDKNTVIMDAYNANPSSMDAAIRNFASLNSFNKKVIIGEMLELGEYSEVEHKRIVELLVSLGFQDVFLVGDGFRSVHDKYLFFSNSDECMDYLKNHSISGCTILLKGSRGVRLEKLMELL
ncbi:MAG TPA: cyanophycin synthetase, partial [Tenuifilaceae bacterium]|nr:cyanophycin synthetase [Tenuifilaceae bacterium]